jgi:predicted  nucleic acid-binding Zn-ribbon protein
MKRLDTAMARFTSALETLETSVGERLAEAREAMNSMTELAILKAERERLYARIAALEEDSRLLAGLTEEVEDRLDGAIAEIREVLGQN